MVGGNGGLAHLGKAVTFCIAHLGLYAFLLHSRSRNQHYSVTISQLMLTANHLNNTSVIATCRWRCKVE